MIEVLNSSQSVNLDNLSIDNNIISESQLIDNAGKAVAYHIIEKFNQPFNKKYLCIAGVGKNGLDAIVCNYYLNLNNINSKLLIINKNKIDFSNMSNYLEEKTVLDINDITNLSVFDWIIDGIFGTGLNREIEDDYYKIINLLNSFKNILSIDMPSGIFANNGVASNIFIKAKQTISFTYPKIGHFLSKGYSASGNLFLYNIGHLDSVAMSKINLIDKNDIYSMIKPLNIDKHKYLNGKVLLLAGSSNYTGAALLSGHATIQSGVGVLKQFVPNSLRNILSNNKEAIDIVLNDCEDGFLSINNYKQIQKYFDWPDCFIIGPGLSVEKKSVDLVSEILKDFTGSCILDGSGFLSLFDYDNNNDVFSKLPKKIILTPHYGELSKILNISVKELNNNTIEILTDISKYLKDRILVLKGPNTIIVNGSGEMHIISNGNQLLATAGSGDVLCGIIASYVASGYSLQESSIIGAYIHSECSRILLNDKNENICASKIIDKISKAQFLLREKL